MPEGVAPRQCGMDDLDATINNFSGPEQTADGASDKHLTNGVFPLIFGRTGHAPWLGQKKYWRKMK